MNHVRFMISPEPYVVQDGVQDNALNLTWFGGGYFSLAKSLGIGYLK